MSSTGRGRAGVDRAHAAEPPVLLPAPHELTVSLRLAFRVGSQDDPPGREGLAGLTAAVMGEGATSRHPYAEILALLYPMAAAYDARVDKELTTFVGRVHRDDAAQFADLVLDAVTRPAFTDADVERLRGRALDTVRNALRYSSDEELARQVLHAAAFAGSRYGHPVIGTVAGLEAITPDEVRGFYREHFTRDRLILGVGGAYPDALPGRLRDGLESLPWGGAPRVPAPAAVQRGERRAVIVDRTGPAAAISFGFPVAVRRGERDFYALRLATCWLGEHRNSFSHLFQVIRAARGLSYGAYSYLEWLPEASVRQMPVPGVPRRRQLFEVWVRPVPRPSAHFALRAAVRELERLYEHGLDRDQLERTREFLARYSLHFAETTAARLGYAVDGRVYGTVSPGHLERLAEATATLTLEEVNAAIRRHLSPDRMVIAVVSDGADGLAEALVTDAPSPVEYASPKPEAVLAEDRLTAVHRLHLRREDIEVVPVRDLFERSFEPKGPR